jgi:hypothetical protein
MNISLLAGGIENQGENGQNPRFIVSLLDFVTSYGIRKLSLVVADCLNTQIVVFLGLVFLRCDGG